MWDWTHVFPNWHALISTGQPLKLCSAVKHACVSSDGMIFCAQDRCTRLRHWRKVKFYISPGPVTCTTSTRCEPYGNRGVPCVHNASTWRWKIVIIDPSNYCNWLPPIQRPWLQHMHNSRYWCRCSAHNVDISTHIWLLTHASVLHQSISPEALQYLHHHATLYNPATISHLSDNFCKWGATGSSSKYRPLVITWEFKYELPRNVIVEDRAHSSHCLFNRFPLVPAPLRSQGYL